MIAVLLYACVRGAPPAPPAPPPQPSPEAEVPSRLDGWSLLQVWEGHYWTDMWGPVAAELAADAVSRGEPAGLWPSSGPPEPAEAELTRQFLSAFGASGRPTAWTWADPEPVREPPAVIGPMVRLSPEVIGVQPLERDDALGLRIWLRALGDEEPRLAVTDWSEEPRAPEGTRQFAHAAVPPSCRALGVEPVAAGVERDWCEDCTVRCSALPIEGGRLVASELVFREGDRVAGSCAAAELRYETGGSAWVGTTCRTDHVDDDELSAEHLGEGMYSSATGPSLPLGWFARGAERWLVVNRFRGPVQHRCLARFPEANQVIEPVACVIPRGDLGGF